MKLQQKTHLIIATGILALLALTIVMSPPDSDTIPYIAIALLAILPRFLPTQKVN